MSNETMMERRHYPRTQVQMALQVLRLDPSGIELIDQVRMTDISRGGIGAVSEKAYYPGQRLILKLPGAGMGVRTLCATVRRSLKVEGTYHLGIEFEHPMASLCADEAGCGSAAAAA